MTRVTKAKVALAAVGLLLFAVGIRLDDARWRYAGIALVAAAWLLRFVRGKAPNEGAPPQT